MKKKQRGFKMTISKTTGVAEKAILSINKNPVKCKPATDNKYQSVFAKAFCQSSTSNPELTYRYGDNPAVEFQQVSSRVYAANCLNSQTHAVCTIIPKGKATSLLFTVKTGARA